MSNLWFNIRFGVHHFQFSRDWEITFRVNPYFLENPPTKWFEIYCLFGKHSGMKRIYNIDTAQ
jgi:hypothetical protein